MITSNSPSSSSASGATYIPPPKARLLATETEYPVNRVRSSSTRTVNRAGFQPTSVRSAA